MRVVNHVDLEKIEASVVGMRADPAKARRLNRIEGEWSCDGLGSAQFKAELQLEGGKFVLEADSPSFLGGSGTRPGPLNYCVFGLTSCFASTFMTIAAMEGVEIKAAKFAGECMVDFSKTFGLSDKPIIESARFKVSVKSEASEEKLERVTKLAEERCPGMYSLTNKINVKTELLTD